MAIALENANKVWQKVAAALKNANPEAQTTFMGVKAYLAQQKGNPDLQFVPFAAADIVAATGYDTTIAACTVYGVYFKKAGTGTTVGFLKLLDGATLATGTTLAAFYHKTVGDNAHYVNPVGLAFATELNVSDTTNLSTGTTATTGASDGVDGFVIIGA